MSGLAIKGALGALTTISTCATIYVGYDHFAERNIKEQLEREGLTILTESSSTTEWQKILGDSTATSTDEKMKKFVERNKEENESTPISSVDEPKLKKACTKVMAKPNKNPDLEDARNYCVQKSS